MPRRQKSGVDNPKRRGKAPPFWSLGVQGRNRNAPAVLLGVQKGTFSHVREGPLLSALPRRAGDNLTFYLKRDHTQMLEQDLEPDQNENDAAGELGAALIARAEHIADVHTRN